jgi:hypothetical protein
MTQKQIIRMIEDTKYFMEVYSYDSSREEYYKGVIEGMNLILQKLKNSSK